MKRIVGKLHLWVSVPFGLVIMITCFTGAMLVFESEITALCSGGASSVEPKGSPMPVWQIIERVEPSLDSGVEVTGVVIPFAADEAYKVNLSKPRRAALPVRLSADIPPPLAICSKPIPNRNRWVTARICAKLCSPMSKPA